ncbi:MAG: lipid II:glycine glycyltransferase FemX [Candidatus Dormibacteria bacterium]
MEHTATGTGTWIRSWDEALGNAEGHVLQGTAWAAVQRALGFSVTVLSGTGWHGLGVILRRPLFGYGYFPYGPVLDKETNIEAMANEIRSWGNDEGLAFVRIEPFQCPPERLMGCSLLRKGRDIQPPFTWRLDLRSSEEELRAALRTRLRGYINSAEKRGITMRTTTDSSDLETFVSLLEKTAENRFSTHGVQYYRTVLRELAIRGAGQIRFAEHEGRPVAAILSFDSPTVRYYAHVAVDDAANRTLKASGPLAWEDILDAKRSGKSWYDFWGVIPEDTPGHPWNGFSAFKKSFGGQLVVSAGSWEIPVAPLRHRIARGLAKVR